MFESFLGDRKDDWTQEGLSMFHSVEGPPGDWALDLPSQRTLHPV